jgi:hypothetical protein
LKKKSADDFVMSIGQRTAVLASLLAALLAVPPARAEKSVHKLKKKLRHTEHNVGKSLEKVGQVVGEGLLRLLPDGESECANVDDCSTSTLELSLSKVKSKQPPQHPPAKHPAPAPRAK